MRLRQIMVGSLLVLFAWPALVFGSSHEPSVRNHEKSAVNQLVSDVCSKRVVLLGEDLHHGSGRTLEVKTQIVKRLVDRCGFRGVLFESSFYEFVHFQHLIDKGKASPKNLAHAIGALWTAADESRPLVRYLFAKAASGDVKLGGLDPQVGSRTAHYEQEGLASDLVKYLPQAQRHSCLVVLRRHDRWNYDDAHPFDASSKQELRVCIDAVRAALNKLHHKGRRGDEATAMARSYGIYLAMHGSSRQIGAGMRDHAMFDHLRWFLGRWPQDTKVIVWTATVHAIKRRARPGAYRPLGAYVHELYGNKTAAIGFTALGGRYGRPGKSSTSVSATSTGSLESSISADSGSGPWYLDSRALQRLGRASGKALNYAKPLPIRWCDMLDGVIVLRNEHPLVPRKEASRAEQP